LGVEHLPSTAAELTAIDRIESAFAFADFGRAVQSGVVAQLRGPYVQYVFEGPRQVAHGPIAHRFNQPGSAAHSAAYDDRLWVQYVADCRYRPSHRVDYCVGHLVGCGRSAKLPQILEFSRKAGRNRPSGRAVSGCYRLRVTDSAAPAGVFSAYYDVPGLSCHAMHSGHQTTARYDAAADSRAHCEDDEILHSNGLSRAPLSQRDRKSVV
jgi:hypothetical protein